MLTYASMDSCTRAYKLLLTANVFISTLLGAGNQIYMVPVPKEFSQAGGKTGVVS